MKGLTRKQEAAIVALLSHDKLKDAAAAIGLSEVTLWRYMQDAAFIAHYRAARRQAVEQATARLQRMMGGAVDALERNLSCENPAVEIRAAQLVIEQSIKGVELIDLQERLERLELILTEHEKGKGAQR